MKQDFLDDNQLMFGINWQFCSTYISFHLLVFK